MVVSLICFAGNSLMLKYLASLRHVDPWVSLSFRAGVGLLLTIALFAPGGTLSLRRSFQTWLLASRGVVGALATGGYYICVGPLGAGKATLITNTWCVFSAVLAAWLLKEKLGFRKMMGIALTMSGLVLLTGLQSGELGEGGRYELIALIGAGLAAAVVIVIRQLTLTESSATIFASQCVYGLVLGIPLALGHFGALHGVDVALLIVAGLCASIGQLAMTEGFRYLTVTAGGAYQTTIPILTTLGSVALFGESFSWLQGVGGGLVLWGMFQTIVSRRG
jgi:drug/metabolite transporter (DMT)-like permease